MNTSQTDSLKIAVVGAGISGIMAAYLLQKKHQVHLLEKNDYIGGHTNTVIIPDGIDRGTPVDTGFIVLNEKTYPNFISFLDQLGVEKRKTDMSFGYFCKTTGLCYASKNLNTLFAQRKNIFSPRYIRFMSQLVRFQKQLRSDYLNKKLGNITLEVYLEQNQFCKELSEWFVVPMAAAIWSGSDFQIQQFPVRSFAQFYENHGLLAVSGHPLWYTVNGGSHSYVRAFLKTFKGKTSINTRIERIKRSSGKVIIDFKDGPSREFDAVVMAAHADESLRLLDDPTQDEQDLLGVWSYSKNIAVLHTDVSVMPIEKRAWASWNYTRDIMGDNTKPVVVTYDMKRLQGLDTHRPYFVTLNPAGPIKKETIIREIEYTHPQYSFEALDSQSRLDRINGRNNTYFCGAYHGYGFHEDGVNSALAVADKFGIRL